MERLISFLAGFWKTWQTWGQFLLLVIITLEWVVVLRLEDALDLEYDVTSRFTGKYFEEEIRGLADASGCSEKRIRRIHMIGELTLVGYELVLYLYSWLLGILIQEGSVFHVWGQCHGHS